MSEEYINGYDPDADKQWAGLIYNDLNVRQSLIRRLNIIYLTDGTISLDQREACDFVNFIATADTGVEWLPDATEEDKQQTANDVLCNFLNMVVEETKHLAKFSVN